MRPMLSAVVLAAGLACPLVCMQSIAAASRLGVEEPPKKTAAHKDAVKKAAPAPAGPTTGVALIEIHGDLSEQPHPLAWLLGSGDHPTLRNVVDLIRDAADDQEVAAVVVRVRDAKVHLTQVEELGAAIAHVRAANKKVILFCGEYETPEAVLASYCDEAIIQAGGGVSVPGMYMEEMYLADTMAWAGLTPQMVQIGDYKGANEEYMHAAPSPAWEQNISGLLDGLYGGVRKHIKTGRKMDDAKLDEAMRQSWMALGDTAKKVGLIDAVVDLPDLTSHLEKYLSVPEGSITWPPYGTEEGVGIDVSNPLTMFSKMMREPETAPTRESLAIVHINGPIVDGESSSGGFMGEASIGSDTVRRAIAEIEDEPLIKGVIVRIDSPGGSATASEVIWQGLNRLQAKKPVWVSVGSMAASGGYYCLVGGQKVYVNPSSIVGSIGVVGGKVSMSGLYEKLKVHVHGRERGPMGRMLAASTPWTEQEQQLVRAKMQETYDLFAKRVSDGRREIDISKTAEGRLFTGEAAVKNRMADKIGGLDDCLTDLAAELKMTEGEYEILEYPGPKSMREVIGESIGGFAAAPNVGGKIAESAGSQMLSGALKEIVGPKNWPQVRDQLSALMQLRKQPVVLTSPRAVIVK